MDAVLEKILRRASDEIYLALRLLTGLMFSFHGMQKVFGVLTDHAPPVGSQVWIGGVIELVAGLAVAAGFLTSYAAFLASGTMAVAYIQFHWRGAFDRNFFPAINKGELGLVYALLFLYIASQGGGRLSVDAARGAKTER
jgi:putative oxidoreductase